VKLINSSGSLINEYDYDIFGNPITVVENKSNPFRYAGYYYDGETGYYYLNARFYDPKVARFITEDSYTGEYSDPLSLNLYTYCHNNPMLCFLRGITKIILNSNKSV
jgi:RHS repeat-associated protein